jgi:hypothetical protein
MEDPTGQHQKMNVLGINASPTPPGSVPTLPSAINKEPGKSKVSEERGWYLGKYIGKIVSGRSKPSMTEDYESIEYKMKRKRQLLKDYYSAHTATEGFSSEFSIVSDLPLLMGWLRKRKPR